MIVWARWMVVMGSFKAWPASNIISDPHASIILISLGENPNVCEGNDSWMERKYFSG